MDLPAEYNYTRNFYAGPLGKMAMGFSAEEFDEWTTLELEGLDLFIVVVSLVHAEGSLTMPQAQGQGFNTAMFKNCDTAQFHERDANVLYPRNSDAT